MGLEIKDLAGLSQPITRLIEVTSAGLGRSTESFFRVRKAKAFAKEVEIVANTLEKHGKILGSVKYTREDIELIAEEAGLDAIKTEEYAQLIQRANLNEFSRSIQKQANTESVLSHAEEELKDDDNVPDKEVDEDWLSLYFSIVENVSSEYMHRLWGKVLAGEIRSPDGFSLRTLELLKTMTIKEAELFSKVVRKSLFVNKDILIVDKEFWKDFYDGLGFVEYNFLEQIGLVQSLGLHFYDLKKGDRIFSTNEGRFLAGIEFEEDVKKFSISYTSLTKTGEDIFSLIQNKDNSMGTLIDFMKTLEVNHKHKKFKGEFLTENKANSRAQLNYIENWS